MVACSQCVFTYISPSCLLQEQMFQLWLRDPASSAYNSGFTAVLEGPLDLPALQTAAQLVVERQQVTFHSQILRHALLCRVCARSCARLDHYNKQAACSLADTSLLVRPHSRCGHVSS